jgi:uncharacterized membrane protein YoaT (DUF817 family)
LKQLLQEFWLFGLKQAWACMFGGFLLFIMLVTRFWYPLESLHRYDFIFLSAVVFQLMLLALRLETLREAQVIIIFHVVATVMELFKTSDAIASWQYPEPWIFGIGNVPLFTGFMYSAVGSYLARVWRIFRFEFTRYPDRRQTWLLCAGIYLNFFSHHFIADLRWLLLAYTAWLFRVTFIHFTVIRTRRCMPLLLGWFLVALFIWFAENIATWANIWIYPNQQATWQMVPLTKVTSWYLLMLLSSVLITVINRVHDGKTGSATHDVPHDRQD